MLQGPDTAVCGMQRPGPKGKGVHFQLVSRALTGLSARLQDVGVKPETRICESWHRADAIEHGMPGGAGRGGRVRGLGFVLNSLPHGFDEPKQMPGGQWRRDAAGGLVTSPVS